MESSLDEDALPSAKKSFFTSLFTNGIKNEKDCILNSLLAKTDEIFEIMEAGKMTSRAAPMSDKLRRRLNLGLCHGCVLIKGQTSKLNSRQVRQKSKDICLIL